jgi:hypothetical protein
VPAQLAASQEALSSVSKQNDHLGLNIFKDRIGKLSSFDYIPISKRNLPDIKIITGFKCSRRVIIDV